MGRYKTDYNCELMNNNQRNEQIRVLMLEDKTFGEGQWLN